MRNAGQRDQKVMCCLFPAHYRVITFNFSSGSFLLICCMRFNCFTRPEYFKPQTQEREEK